VIRQDPSTDPEQLTEQVRRVMERPEFRYDKSWFDRLSEWIARQLERLFGGEPSGGNIDTGSGFAGGIGSILAWLLILAAVAAVIAVVVYVVRHRVRAARSDDGPDTSIEIEHRRSASEWASDADRLESEREWKAALRARYRQLVRTLVDRRQLPDVAGRTTGELREDLSVTTPGASAAFDTASLLFELAWYAHVPTGPEQSSELRRAADAVLAATPERHTDQGSGRATGPPSEIIEVRA